MMEGGVGIKLGMISPELLKDYLEVWWTILSCAIALGRFSDILIGCDIEVLIRRPIRK